MTEIYLTLITKIEFIFILFLLSLTLTCLTILILVIIELKLWELFTPKTLFKQHNYRD